MTSRERLRTALDHCEPDRVPFDLGTTPVTGIHVRAYQALVEVLGLDVPEPTLVDPVQQLAAPDERVLAALGADLRSTLLRLPYRTLDNPWQDERYIYFEDEWGLTRRMPREEGLYFDLCGHPLRGVQSVSEVETHRWPDPVASLNRDLLQQVVDELDQSGYGVVTRGYGAGFLELLLWLQGYEDGYVNLLANPAVTDAILDKILEIKLSYAQAVLETVGDKIDVFYLGDDLATQRGPQVSEDLYLRYFHPRYCEYHGLVRRLAPGAKIFFHCCGNVYDLLPHLVDTPLDILNPVQVSAGQMGDTARLKREFGARLSFWGAVDTQHVLPHGTVEDVKAEVRRRLDDLAPGGGYVLTAVHNVQADVPPGNVLAMVEALMEYGWY
ncbi:MAG: uroporphyrinogen decarboxylase family protein [Armatimonadota bacterium]